MVQRSVLSNVINYVQYNGNPRDYFKLNIKALEKKNHRKMHDRLQEGDEQVKESDFGNTSDKLKGEYLDMYDGVKSEVLHATKIQ